MEREIERAFMGWGKMKREEIYIREPIKYRMNILKLRKRDFGYKLFLFPIIIPTLAFFTAGFIGTLIIYFLEHKMSHMLKAASMLGFFCGIFGGIVGIFASFISQTVCSRLWFYKDNIKLHYEFKTANYKYTEIKAFHFLQQPEAENIGTALSILFRNGTHFTIGLRKNIDNNLIKSFLEGKGIRYCESIQNKEEWPMCE